MTTFFSRYSNRELCPNKRGILIFLKPKLDNIPWHISLFCIAIIIKNLWISCIFKILMNLCNCHTVVFLWLLFCFMSRLKKCSTFIIIFANSTFRFSIVFLPFIFFYCSDFQRSKVMLFIFMKFGVNCWIKIFLYWINISVIFFLSLFLPIALVLKYATFCWLRVTMRTARKNLVTNWCVLDARCIARSRDITSREKARACMPRVISSWYSPRDAVRKFR